MMVTAEMVDGHAAAVLVERSRRAQLLVVGHRGEGGFTELLVGSVAIHTAAHAHCPVVVVRGTRGAADAPVIVGVDGSSPARHAVRFAFDTAARRRAPLRVVAVWPARPKHPDDEERATTAVDALTVILREDVARYPGIVVRAEILHDPSPAAALIRAADGAGLVVVGSRGLGGLREALLGSVGRALIEHAPCPVAIVRSTG